MTIGEQCEIEEMLGRRPTQLELAQIRHFQRKTIRKYANYHQYTDVDAYEVVRKVSENCVEIRAMKTTQTKSPKDFHPGGFVGHFADNRSGQEYKYESNPEASVIRIRWSEANSQWQKGKYMRFLMSDAPYKFHDYNF